MRFVRHACELTLQSGRSYRFRRGDRVGICPPLTHLDEEVFGQADQFQPQRWLTSDSSEGGEDAWTAEQRTALACGRKALSKGGAPLANAFLPFGGGPTLCPGRRFARNEVKALLVVLFRHLDLELTSTVNPGHDGSRAGVGIFPPKHDIDICVKHLAK